MKRKITTILLVIGLLALFTSSALASNYSFTGDTYTGTLPVSPLETEQYPYQIVIYWSSGGEDRVRLYYSEWPIEVSFSGDLTQWNNTGDPSYLNSISMRCEEYTQGHVFGKYNLEGGNWVYSTTYPAVGTSFSPPTNYDDLHCVDTTYDVQGGVDYTGGPLYWEGNVVEYPLGSPWSVGTSTPQDDPSVGFTMSSNLVSPDELVDYDITIQAENCPKIGLYVNGYKQVTYTCNNVPDTPENITINYQAYGLYGFNVDGVTELVVRGLDEYGYPMTGISDSFDLYVRDYATEHYLNIISPNTFINGLNNKPSIKYNVNGVYKIVTTVHYPTNETDTFTEYPNYVQQTYDYSPSELDYELGIITITCTGYDESDNIVIQQVKDIRMQGAVDDKTNINLTSDFPNPYSEDSSFETKVQYYFDYFLAILKLPFKLIVQLGNELVSIVNEVQSFMTIFANIFNFLPAQVTQLIIVALTLGIILMFIKR